jgi:hypothetical protein
MSPSPRAQTSLDKRRTSTSEIRENDLDIILISNSPSAVQMKPLKGAITAGRPV